MNITNRVWRVPGGIHPHGAEDTKKLTSNKAITAAPVPDRLIVPLAQHIGAPCQPTVVKGERVLFGQTIGESAAFVSAPIHASCSGIVLDISPCLMPNGTQVNSIIIDNDYLDEPHPSVAPIDSPETSEAATLITRVRQCGIVGLGGAAFPTHVKLSPPKDDTIDTLVINGVECEPYLTIDHRIMIERTTNVLDGATLAARMLGISNIIVGVEANKPDAIDALKAESLNERFSKYKINVVSLPVKYPQGGEKQLIYALTGRKVPVGALPSKIGIVVLNAATCDAISTAIRTGRPLVERSLTITGLVEEPMNVAARIGTPLSDLIEFCGGLKPNANQVVLGGPMMGMTMPRLDSPLIKGNGGLLAIEGDFEAESACIKCGRCVRACPMNLLPAMIDAYARRLMWEDALRHDVMSCIECGACAYVCPAKRRLVQSIRTCKRNAPKPAKKNA